MISPCATCTRSCCRHHLVTVTGYDVWVIAKGLRLAPEQFLLTVPQQKPNGRGFLLNDPQQTYDIALDKAPAKTEAKPCVFWLEFPNGIGRCGIYPLRPYVCQTYPAFLNNLTVERREDVLCLEDAWRDGSLQQPVWRERLCRMQVEFDIYGLAVARWNYHVQRTAHPKLISVLGYYTYLMNYYARLEPLRVNLEASEWQAMSEQWSKCRLEDPSPLVAEVAGMERWSKVIETIRAVTDQFFPNDLFLGEVEAEKASAVQEHASTI